jgi:hypothetical protein
VGLLSSWILNLGEVPRLQSFEDFLNKPFSIIIYDSMLLFLIENGDGGGMFDGASAFKIS